MAVKTWFITGTSRGFGREVAIAALDRGDQVAATRSRRQPGTSPASMIWKPSMVRRSCRFG
jgi:NAD(P)-dependent dehydrogenase (short-subunit alcohol dehydrogenase family)